MIDQRVASHSARDSSRFTSAGRVEMAWLSLVASVALVSLVGCQEPETPSIQRTGVAGTVTLDGKPLQAGAIIFHSQPTVSETSPKPAFAYIKGGQYRIGAESGPSPGVARVEFRAKPLERGEMEDSLDQSATSRRRKLATSIVEIPEKYGAKSKLTVDLVADQNACDFDLQSRP